MAIPRGMIRCPSFCPGSALARVAALYMFIYIYIYIYTYTHDIYIYIYIYIYRRAYIHRFIQLAGGSTGTRVAARATPALEDHGTNIIIIIIMIII